MREILFRGKRLDNGEWVEGTPFHRKSFYGSPDDRLFMLTGEELHYDYYEAHEVDPATVGQFTGLLDENGLRIFEGDVVDILTENEEIGVIAYEDGGFLVNADGFCVDFRTNINGTDLEIIGNIHDNPELLEAADGQN